MHGFVEDAIADEVQTQEQKAALTAVSGGGVPGLLAWPKVDFVKFGAVERKDLGRIKKISGANLHRNWVLIPHVTNNDDAYIAELEAFRVSTNKENEKSGLKVTRRRGRWALQRLPRPGAGRLPARLAMRERLE